MYPAVSPPEDTVTPGLPSGLLLVQGALCLCLCPRTLAPDYMRPAGGVEGKGV